MGSLQALQQWTASDTENSGAGMSTRVAPPICWCLCRSNGHQPLPIQWHSADASRHWYALSFQAGQEWQPIKASIPFTSERFPLPVYRSKTKMIGQQIQICLVIGCRSPDVEENKACRVGILPLVHQNLKPIRGKLRLSAAQGSPCMSPVLRWSQIYTVYGCNRSVHIYVRFMYYEKGHQPFNHVLAFFSWKLGSLIS